MPRTETHLIHVTKSGKTQRALPAKRASAAQERKAFDTYQRQQRRAERAHRQFTERSDGVTRCSKCPPRSCCPTCAQINRARQQAGLIRPRGSPEPHPNNCYQPCIPAAHIKPTQPIKTPVGCSTIISIDVTFLGGGWWLGQALLGRDVIYERKFRSRDAARRYAVNSMVDIREGLRFEADHD